MKLLLMFLAISSNAEELKVPCSYLLRNYKVFSKSYSDSRWEQNGKTCNFFFVLKEGAADPMKSRTIKKKELLDELAFLSSKNVEGRELAQVVARVAQIKQILGTIK